MKVKAVIAGAAAFALAGTLVAQEKVYESEPGPWMIPDEDPNGLRVEIDVTEHGNIESFESVGIFGFDHTWAGDLIVTLTHKDTGTSVTLLDRPGVPETTFGDSADFLGDYQWADGGFVYDEDIFDDFVPTDRDYGPTAGTLSQFEGEDKFGTWSLFISDNAGGDTGQINQWGFIVINPAPGTVALLGMAGLCGRRRRRR